MRFSASQFGHKFPEVRKLFLTNFTQRVRAEQKKRDENHDEGFDAKALLSNSTEKKKKKRLGDKLVLAREV